MLTKKKWSFMVYKNIFISCGELSGEIHLNNLITVLKKQNHQLRFYGIGSHLLKKNGCNILVDYKDISIIGFVEVIRKYLYIKKRLKEIKQFIHNTPLSLMILVDFPGFNFYLAHYAQKRGIKIIYFIPPQIWAWHYKRIFKMKQFCSLVIPILPFESRIYKNQNMNYKYCGHPIIDNIKVTLTKNQFYKKFHIPINKKIIALFPGSRESEIKNNLPVMAHTLKEMETKYSSFVFVINRSPTIDDKLLHYILKPYKIKNLLIVSGQNYNLLQAAYMGILVSGTITLEATYFSLPHVIIYKINYFSYYLFRWIAHISFIGLPNLMARKLIVTELIQRKLTPSTLLTEVDKIILSRPYYDNMKKNLKKVKGELGHKGVIPCIAQEILPYV